MRRAVVFGLFVSAPLAWATASPDPDRLATTQLLPTDDGATIALHHHPGPGAPVLLVHGISCNHRFFDLDAQHSLADWLVGRGWDVWMLDLRGHGDAMWTTTGARQAAGWTVDDYGEHDLPAAIERIRMLTGYDQVDYVGHSMGGMVAAVYAETAPDPHLGGMVILGSPMAFSTTDPLFKLAQAGMSAGGTFTLFVDSPTFAEAAAGLGAWSPGRLHERLYNPAHLTKSTQEALLRTVVAPLSRKEMAHFARMIRAGSFVSWDGGTDWRLGLGAVHVPTLVVAGLADQIAYPPRVRAYYEGLGGERAWHEAPAYGHLDLVLGESAATDVYPVLGSWLEAHPPHR